MPFWNRANCLACPKSYIGPWDRSCVTSWVLSPFWRSITEGELLFPPHTAAQKWKNKQTNKQKKKERKKKKPAGTIYLSNVWWQKNPRIPIQSHVMASSAIALQLGIFGFLPTTHTETNANKMRPWSSRTVRRFMSVYLCAQTVVYMCTWQQIAVILLAGKTQDTPNLSPMPG